jgi:hypothetical protein
MKELIKRSIRKLSRLAARELRLVGPGDSFNLNEIAFLVAAVESVQFSEQNMAGARAISSDLELLRHAVLEAPSEGLILEFGVASGRTIRHLAGLTSRTIHGFDSFEGLPEAWRPGFEKGAFAQPLPTVPNNVVLHKGWFSETLPKFLEQHSDSVALLHIDCDLYSSTSLVLKYLKERVRSGTVIVFDEYFNYPGWRQHEHKAFEEMIKDSDLTFRFDAFVPSHQQVCVIIS